MLTYYKGLENYLMKSYYLVYSTSALWYTVLIFKCIYYGRLLMIFNIECWPYITIYFNCMIYDMYWVVCILHDPWLLILLKIDIHSLDTIQLISLQLLPLVYFLVFSTPTKFSVKLNHQLDIYVFELRLFYNYYT